MRRQSPVTRLAVVFVAIQALIPAVVQGGRLFLGWETTHYGWLMFSIAP